jgi:beta-glucosidase
MLTRFFILAILIHFSIIMQGQEYPFNDPNLPIAKRVDDLISRMTLEEKVGQLIDAAPAIDRLGVPQYNWWNECLHGVARNGRATVFPQAIGLAATFDTDLMYRVGRAISMEARAKYNLAVQYGAVERYQGLTFWSPNINIFRDPRWGRGQETYGEDPFLTSRIGVSFVKGLQGDHPTYMQAAGLAKHYAVHNGPEKLRHEFDAVVSMKDIWETYLPAFEALVTEAKVEGVMGAYNRTNGIPCCAHPYLMQEVLREKWGFKGYYVTDCGALEDFYKGHLIAETPAEAAAMALNVGTNLNCGSTYLELTKSVEEGLTTEEEIDNNLRELLPTRFKLGLFDPPGTVPFDTIGPEWIRKKEHIDLSLEAAEKSVVLLKNSNNTLPIDPEVSSVFVTGPNATHIQGLLANYHGISEDLKTLLEGIVANTSPQTSVNYRQGALLDEQNRNPIDWYSGVAASSEVTIACMGISQLLEGEEGGAIMSSHFGDRQSISLPQNQIDFLKKIRSRAKKLVVVLLGGSAIACPEVYEMADALVYAWYPGEQGGLAVGNILFGKTVPSGKLPVTFPKSLDDLPPFEDYSMKNRTYRYMQKEPLFPFGFGLSYSAFSYGEVAVSKSEIGKEEGVRVFGTLTNEGDLDAEEVVQLYIKDVKASEVVPLYTLKGFQRISLKAGESKAFSFEVKAEDLKMVNSKGEKVLESGEFKIYIGGSVPSQRSLDLGAAAFKEISLRVK